MASFRGHILNAAIRYAGKRRLADLEFTPAAIAASRARMDRLGDRVALAPTLTRHTRRSRRRADRMDARQSSRRAA